jgi:hypothetical protein
MRSFYCGESEEKVCLGRAMVDLHRLMGRLRLAPRWQQFAGLAGGSLAAVVGLRFIVVAGSIGAGAGASVGLKLGQALGAVVGLQLGLIGAFVPIFLLGFLVTFAAARLVHRLCATFAKHFSQSKDGAK